LIYHSVSTKAVVGVAKITQESYPDPTDATKKWVAVRVEPVLPMVEPVTLQQVKESPALADIPLVRQGRLSVMPLSESDFKAVLAMGRTTLPAKV
jgi:predicted RNA-binding protein with PUA-like domain